MNPDPASRQLLERLAEQLRDCRPGDRTRLTRRLDKIVAALDEPGRHIDPSRIIDLAKEITDAQQALQKRLRSLPQPTFPEELPVSAERQRIADAIRANQVIVLCGETGSGKTTQLPKICLTLGRGVLGDIGHTQPRRIAARTVAARIAQEMNTPLGGVVGYKVRFGDKTTPDTIIRLMTDGILLAETQSDPDLLSYDTIIIDEAHERSLNIDFLLGYLKRLLPRRPDLKVIVTSATIDPQRFSKHFNDCPILEISGRTYPVEVRYRPTEVSEDNTLYDLPTTVADTVDQLWAESPGDTLVFFATERDIRDTTEVLKGRLGTRGEVLPLYARLSIEEQNRAFAPGQIPRVVLATNVAETSITVPGIRYVIDPGYARISRYSPKSKVQRLPIEPVSQASSNQRSGRCGRVGPGIAVRLFAEEEFNNRPVFTDPEILRTNLAEVILQMLAYGLGEIEQFPFIDPPDVRQIRDGYNTLWELGAVTQERTLTPLGRDLARLPTDPHLGRMILQAEKEDVLDEVLIIAAALSVQDVRERPLDAAEQADAAHARFRDERSDFLSLLKLWQAFHAKQRELSGSKLRKWCKENFLSYVRVREWMEVHRQLRQITADQLIEKRRLRRSPDHPQSSGRNRSAPRLGHPSSPRSGPRPGRKPARPPRRQTPPPASNPDPVAPPDDQAPPASPVGTTEAPTAPPV
jgi:ATP-dependent helicase HrpA